MLKKSKIIDKLNKLATKLDELGMISEADRIDTISKLLGPGEAWYCPIELDDPMDNFFDFLRFTKNICNDDSKNRNSAQKYLLESKSTNPGDMVIELLEEKHEKIIEDLKSDLEKI